MKYEETSSNKTIAANMHREEEKYNPAQRHDSGVIS